MPDPKPPGIIVDVPPEPLGPPPSERLAVFGPPDTSSTPPALGGSGGGKRIVYAETFDLDRAPDVDGGGAA